MCFILQHESGDGVPFYRIPISTVIQQIMGRDDIAGSLVRYPVIGHAEYTYAYLYSYFTRFQYMLALIVRCIMQIDGAQIQDLLHRWHL